VVERAQARGEGGRKSARVRRQGESCPDPKYLKVFKYMNRRVGRARCFTQVLLSRCLNTCFHFSESKDTHYSLYLWLPGLCRSNYKVSTCFKNVWCSTPQIRKYVFLLTLMKIGAKKSVLKANQGTASCWFSFHSVLWPCRSKFNTPLI